MPTAHDECGTVNDRVLLPATDGVLDSATPIMNDTSR